MLRNPKAQIGLGILFLFVLFAVMCGLFAASLFYMDRVRRRRSGEE